MARHFDVMPAGLRVASIAAVRREDIVLAERTVALVERNTLGFAREAERLSQLGLSAKKGVLLHGPPGTGKTLIVRWLIGQLPGYTKFIITAGASAGLAHTYHPLTTGRRNP